MNSGDNKFNTEDKFFWSLHLKPYVSSNLLKTLQGHDKVFSDCLIIRRFFRSFPLLFM